MTANELFDAVKRAQSWPSEYRLAKELNLSASTLRHYRRGRALPPDDLVLHLAELAGVEPARALAGIAAERTSSERARAVWRKIASAAAVLLAVQIAPWTDTGSALIQGAIASAAPVDSLYIMRTGAAWLALVLALAAVHFFVGKIPTREVRDARHAPA